MQDSLIYEYNLNAPNKNKRFYNKKVLDKTIEKYNNTAEIIKEDHKTLEFTEEQQELYEQAILSGNLQNYSIALTKEQLEKIYKKE